jgi:transcriptional regulator with XRE-family HTH domain
VKLFAPQTQLYRLFSTLSTLYSTKSAYIFAYGKIHFQSGSEYGNMEPDRCNCFIEKGTMSEEEEIRSSQFAEWLNQQLQKHGWTQGKLIAQSGNTKEERLSSAAVSRYSTGKMLPDAASCQKIARAFDVPVELVLRKAGLIGTPFSDESDWLQRAMDDLAYAVEVGQLSEEGRLALTTHIRRERLLHALERIKERQNGRREETKQHSPS